MLLVIHHADSININEPLIDTHTTAINFPAHEQFMAPASSPVAPSFGENRRYSNVHNESNDNIKLQTNQSAESPRNAINHAIIIDDENGDGLSTNVQTFNRSPLLESSSNTRTNLLPAKTVASGGKVYNKNDLRKRKIKSADIDQLADWKCPNISENSRYLECGCDIPYTLRCSGDIHGLQQIAQGLRMSKYPVSLLDCTLKNVTFLSDARIFDNVSLHGLVISSGEIKRVHRQAFVGMKTQLQALGLPNNALSSVPSQSLAPLTSLDRLDLSNNRIKYLDSSDFLVSPVIFCEIRGLNRNTFGS